MGAQQTTMVYFNDGENTGVSEKSDNFEDFVSGVEVGDYITVVYQTPSNAGSWHRAGGTVTSLRTLEGRFDDLHFEIEDSDRDESGEKAYLHANPDTRDYYFSDNPDTEDNWGIVKVAWTPE